MQSERKKIDDLFGQGLHDYHEAPPMYAWDQIEEDLRADRRKKRMIFLRSAAAVALLLTAFSVGYFYPTKSPHDNITSQTTHPITPNVDNITNPNTKNIINQPDYSSEIAEQSVTTDMNAFADASDLPDKKSISDQIPAISLISEQSSGTHPVESLFRLLPIKFDEIKTKLKAPDNFYNPLHKNLLKAEHLLHYVVNDIPGGRSNSDNHNWEVGGVFSPVYSYKQSGGAANEKFNYITDNTSLDPVSEQPIVTMSMGLDATYDLSERLSIQSGVYYSQLGHSNQDVLLERSFTEQPSYAINTPAGGIDLDGMPVEIYQNRDDATVREVELIKEKVDFNLEGQADINVTQHFNYVEIPVLFKYRLNNGKFNLNLIGGMSTAVLVKNYSLMKYDNSEYLISKTQDINNMLYNGVAGLGMVYQISDRLVFNMEPTFRYALRSISSQNDIIYRPYSMGWYTGIRYKF